jgi:hypothetical protein
MPNLVWPGLILLVAFFAVAAVDGLYFHLWRFRLYARAESRLEHVLHTVRAVLSPPIIWALYVAEPAPLVLAGALVAVDLLVTLVDVWIEPQSRHGLGGLPRAEYLAHISATMLHVAALALGFISRLQATSPELPSSVRTLALLLIAGATLPAVHHVALLFTRPSLEANRRPV